MKSFPGLLLCPLALKGVSAAGAEPVSLAFPSGLLLCSFGLYREGRPGWRLGRAWPNWVSREGARGMAYNARGDPKNPPRREPDLLFTRMLSGPMDFTPGIPGLTGRGGAPIPSTLARQLGPYALRHSPIQMAADLPDIVARDPGAIRFIRDVPTDWAETQVLAGGIGEHAVVVLQDRTPADRDLGAGTDERACSLDVQLSFLVPGRRCEAQIYRDGDKADCRTDMRFRHVTERRRVTARDRLVLKLASGGRAGHPVPGALTMGVANFGAGTQCRLAPGIPAAKGRA